MTAHNRDRSAVRQATCASQFSVEYSYRGAATTNGQIGIPDKCGSNAPELWMFDSIFRSPLTMLHNGNIVFADTNIGKCDPQAQ